MKRRNRRQYKDPSPPLSIYFIGVGSYLFIKIGVSEDVEKELKNIQERNPSYPLTLLGYISGCDEKAEKGLFVLPSTLKCRKLNTENVEK
jgi:hypothetical protein